MAQMVEVVLQPRKTPVQARSAASVEAILEATVQLLLAVGKERLTTTRVAVRAGVSVGTLYQYFPNKQALLQAVLRLHLDGMADAVEEACLRLQGQSLRAMVTGVVEAFLARKMENPAVSVALYAVSGDVDGATIVRETGARLSVAMVAMLESTSDELLRSPVEMVRMLQGAMAGVSRGLVETERPERVVDGVREELVFFACSYAEACRRKQSGE